jgi:YfiH family protein
MSPAQPSAEGSPWPADWLVPDWPAPPWVRAVFTSRAGGVSSPPFDSFNLGEHVRDDPQSVAANRQRLKDLLGGAQPVFLQQVHGTAVLELGADTADGAVADAALSHRPGRACTVMVADCLPVLLAHRTARVVAAAHAGWRGLAGGPTSGQGVLETSFAALVKAVQQQDHRATPAQVAADTLAWLGPCIGPDAFEVGPEVREAFVTVAASDADGFKAHGLGRFLAHLPWLARQRLHRLGIRLMYGNNGLPSWCTVSQPLRFFSHRRDAVIAGSTGRMAACIWLA